MSSQLEMAPLQKIKLQDTHPNLYKGITAFALISLGLGLNFIFLKAAFNPYKLSTIMGVVFVVLGVGQLILLNLRRNLKLLRMSMAIGVGCLLFYGGALTTFYFQTHSTSLQLPITYFGLSALQFAFLIEPPTNPANRNGNGRNL